MFFWLTNKAFSFNLAIAFKPNVFSINFRDLGLGLDWTKALVKNNNKGFYIKKNTMEFLENLIELDIGGRQTCVYLLQGDLLRYVILMMIWNGNGMVYLSAFIFAISSFKASFQISTQTFKIMGINDVDWIRVGRFERIRDFCWKQGISLPSHLTPLIYFILTVHKDL